jgi:hypothetical protein
MVSPVPNVNNIQYQGALKKLSYINYNSNDAAEVFIIDVHQL